MTSKTGVVAWLERNCPGEWKGLPPPKPETVEAIERHFNVSLPDDFRELLLTMNGGSLDSHPSKFLLCPAEDIIHWNEDFLDTLDLPNMILFGGDGSDCVFFYDPENRLGRGAFAIFEVELGNPGLEESWYISRSLTELIALVLADKDLYAMGVSYDDGPE